MIQWVRHGVSHEAGELYVICRMEAGNQLGIASIGLVRRSVFIGYCCSRATVNGSVSQRQSVYHGSIPLESFKRPCDVRSHRNRGRGEGGQSVFTIP